MKLININTVISDLESTINDMEESQLKGNIESHIGDLKECVKQIENARIKIDRALDEINDTVY